MIRLVKEKKYKKKRINGIKKNRTTAWCEQGKPQKY